MKKFVVLALCAAFTLGAVALSACGGNQSEDPEKTPEAQTPSTPQPEPPEAKPLYGVIEGDWSETDAETLGGLLAGVDLGAIIGDMNDPDWAFGLEYETYGEGKLNFSYAMGHGMVLASGFDANVYADYMTVIRNTGAAFMGAGSASIELTNGYFSYDGYADLYNDSQNFYAATDEHRISIPYLSIFGELYATLFGGGGSAGERDPELPDTEEPDCGIIAGEVLSTLHITPYIDTADGLKIKLTAGIETAAYLLSDFGVGIISDEYYDTVRKSLVFSEFETSLFFEFDADGGFARASVTCETEFSLNVPRIETLGTPAASLTVKYRGGTAISAYAGTVTLPDDLDEYVSITDIFEDIV